MKILYFIFFAMSSAIVAKHILKSRGDEKPTKKDIDALSRIQRKEENDLHKIETQYGKLIKQMEIGAEPGGAPGAPGAEPVAGCAKILLNYVCPFSYLWVICTRCSGMVRFLKEHVLMNAEMFRAQHNTGAEPGADRPARIALYMDEVTPGNVHRPDKGRCYTAVYWTFMDFPSWFLRTPCGWFILCFISAKDIDNIKGKESQLFRMILKMLSLIHI